MIPRSQVKADSSAFTLIEILVVVAIIGILVALSFPALNKAKLGSASAKAISNFKQIAGANSLFAADNNGEILGWGRYNVWNDDVYLMRNLNLYLNGTNVSGTSAAALSTIGVGLEPFVDPLVPAENIRYTAYFPFTWSINSIFNRANGRFYQYGGAQASWSTTLNPRRTVEFDKPAATLFAVSGGFESSRTSAADAALLNPTSARPHIFYLYGSKNTTPGAFLDGHVEMLRFPISPEAFIPAVN